MDSKTHLLCENAQCITLAAWPILYGDGNPYNLDRLALLIMLREWGEEFEASWDYSSYYFDAIEDFTARKIAAFFEERNLPVPENISMAMPYHRSAYLL